MRLHHLTVTAFGPFAGTVEVPFDELSEAGLFLLSGATGAGKTSVLDAVCFALYGDVPGERSAAKRLRCDQAEQFVAPRVVLEATLAGRRFRLERSPAWERPKKRGSGTTTEPAGVTLSELTGQGWTPLSSRIDEVGHLVTRLVGMNLTQFTQVALLPQGRFQTFLRARSEERHQLLQRLFRTGRFEDVERWLGERRRSLRRSCEAHEQRVEVLLGRIGEASGATAPEHPEEQSGWARELAEVAQAFEAETARRQQVAATDEEQARTRLERARAQRAAFTRLSAARHEQQQLDEQSASVAAHEQEVALARRAAPVLPLARRAERAEAARRTAAAAVAQLPAPLREVGAARAAQQRATEAAVRIQEALPLERRLHQLRTDAGGGEHDLHRLTAEVATAEQRLVVVEASRELEQLEARLAAHERSSDLAEQVAAARERLLEAREETLRARGHVLDVRAARIEGMAAEIAGALAVGMSCPVCGSAEHPHRAEPTLFSPDEADERAAQVAADDAAMVEQLRDNELRDLTTLLARAHEAAGEEPPALLAAAVEAQEARLQGRPRAPGDPARVAAELRRLAERAAATRARLEAVRAEMTAAAERLEAVRSEAGEGPLEELLAGHRAAQARARAAVEQLEQLVAAQGELDTAAAELAAGLREAGWADTAQAEQAARPAQHVEQLDARVAAHHRRRAACEAVLADPGLAEVRDLDEADLPDPEEAAQAHREHLAALGRVQSEHTVWASRAERLRTLASRLGEELAGGAPLRADLELTTRLAAFVEGKSPDNSLQMRLSAFVLAYRLGQVVAAANERLARMSDQRYVLEHTGRRGVGESRGGLSLAVRDDWSGESRDPATLSGGETFVVSLALALGLADVITAEAGGAALETLFVDEGFGSLDAETLDDVLDVLDSLRDGGRVVGVVSHVAEMRDRIPTQLVVTKSRRGSSLAVSG